jgi:hypothetical protein
MIMKYCIIWHLSSSVLDLVRNLLHVNLFLWNHRANAHWMVLYNVFMFFFSWSWSEVHKRNKRPKGVKKGVSIREFPLIFGATATCIWMFWTGLMSKALVRVQVTCKGTPQAKNEIQHLQGRMRAVRESQCNLFRF